MNQNNNQGGYPGGVMPPMGQEQRSQKQKKDKINSVELQGIVESRGRDQEIRFFAFSRGGGAIHINVKTQEPTDKSDDNGFPIMKTTYVPVNVMTNKNITAEQLKTVVPGMKVHVVGRLSNESYEDKNGNKRTTLSVYAYVFEVLAMPMQAVQPEYPQPSAPMYGGQPQYGGQPYPGMYPGPQPLQYGGQPVYPQPGYPQPSAPMYSGQPQYGGQPYPQGYPQGGPQPGAQPAPGQYGGHQPQQGKVFNDPNDLPIGDVNLG